MKINKVFMILGMCFFVQIVSAATFIISNFSGASVSVVPRWDRGKEESIVLEEGKKSKKYNTNGHNIHSIMWRQNGKMYTANFDNIKSGLMLDREFAILENGKFQHTFVNFPKKMDYGQALIWPPV